MLILKCFSSQLAHIVSRRKFGLCIVVIDGTDPEFSSVRKLRDAIKSTPCILAINKSDLLPRMSRYDLNYLKQRAQAGRTRVIDAYAVSAQNGTGMVQLAEGIVSELAGKDVFVVGSANVGKSTLVKSLSSLLARTLRFRGKNKRFDDKRRGILKKSEYYTESFARKLHYKQFVSLAFHQRSTQFGIHQA